MRFICAIFDNLLFRIVVHIICLALVILGLIFYMFSLIIIGVACEIVFLIVLYLMSLAEKRCKEKSGHSAPAAPAAPQQPAEHHNHERQNHDHHNDEQR